jgi:hypothetical protein
VSKVRPKCTFDVTILFHVGQMNWAQRGQPTLQLGAGQSCRHFASSEWCVVVLSFKHILVKHTHLNTFPSPFCSKNKLGAAGAEELIKGNWPELLVLNIRWDELHADMHSFGEFYMA